VSPQNSCCDLIQNVSFAGEPIGRQAIVTAGGSDVLHDMLMLGSGHSEEEGSVDHALMLLEFMMRHTEFALMFTQQVSSPFSPPYTRVVS
jgi:hypothetical protein